MTRVQLPDQRGRGGQDHPGRCQGRPTPDPGRPRHTRWQILRPTCSQCRRDDGNGGGRRVELPQEGAPHPPLVAEATARHDDAKRRVTLLDSFARGLYADHLHRLSRRQTRTRNEGQREDSCRHSPPEPPRQDGRRPKRTKSSAAQRHRRFARRALTPWSFSIRARVKSNAAAMPSAWRSFRELDSNSANTPSMSRKALPAAVRISFGC
jgi:hypothetical protein